MSVECDFFLSFSRRFLILVLTFPYELTVVRPGHYVHVFFFASSNTYIVPKRLKSNVSASYRPEVKSFAQYRKLEIVLSFLSIGSQYSEDTSHHKRYLYVQVNSRLSTQQNKPFNHKDQ